MKTLCLSTSARWLTCSRCRGTGLERCADPLRDPDCECERCSGTGRLAIRIDTTVAQQHFAKVGDEVRRMKVRRFRFHAPVRYVDIS